MSDDLEIRIRNAIYERIKGQFRRQVSDRRLEEIRSSVMSVLREFEDELKDIPDDIEVIHLGEGRILVSRKP